MEEAPSAVKREIARIHKLELMADDPKCPAGTKLRALDLAHKIDKEVFIDRTFPQLSRVQVTGAMLHGTMDSLGIGPEQSLSDVVKEIIKETKHEKVEALDVDYDEDPPLENGNGNGQVH